MQGSQLFVCFLLFSGFPLLGKVFLTSCRMMGRGMAHYQPRALSPSMFRPIHCPPAANRAPSPLHDSGYQYAYPRNNSYPTLHTSQYPNTPENLPSGRSLTPRNVPTPCFSPMPDEQGSMRAVAVTNLDYNITAGEWKQILSSTFDQHVQVGRLNS